MDIFRSMTKTVLGTVQTDSQPNGAETIERLLDRVESSTLIEDRRDACHALKALSRKYRVLVGAHGMDTLIKVLESDRSDHEIVHYALESLVNITSDEQEEEQYEQYSGAAAQETLVAEQFTEIFIKKHENISVIISFFDEFDFKVRYPSVKLLANLLRNKPKELQEAILVIPSGVSKLMDLLSDTREIIRNDTLLILTNLTQGNSNLQKIVVFENAFDHLFEILEKESFEDGGIVIEDCLQLMLSLIKNNHASQMFFSEGSYIKKLSEFLKNPINAENDLWTWTPKRMSSFHYVLKVLGTLLSPQNPLQMVLSCQDKMRKSGVLERLCNLLMAVGVPVNILSDAIRTVAEVIRGCKENQDYFNSVKAPSSPPKPVSVILLMSMVNKKQPFSLRCAVLYCFQSFLYRNEDGQEEIVQTLFPKSEAASQMSAGQFLIGGLFSPDPSSNWFSAVALAHVLCNNNFQKEQLLRVQLSSENSEAVPVSLLQKCVSLLHEGKAPSRREPHTLTRLGVLQLLSTWLADCPVAVSQFISNADVIPHMISFITYSQQEEKELICQGMYSFLLGICLYFNDSSVPSYTKSSLETLISNRVGVDIYIDKVESILKSEDYSKAAKNAFLVAKSENELVFDYEFTKLYKVYENFVINSIRPNFKAEISEQEKNYQSVIQEQDFEIKRLQTVVQTLENKIISFNKTTNVDVNGSQKGLPSVHRRSGSQGTSINLNGVSGSFESELLAKVTHLESELGEMTYARDYYYYQMMEKENALKEQLNNKPNGADPNYDNLRKQLDDLQLVLYKKDEELTALKSKFEEYKLNVVESKLEAAPKYFPTSTTTRDSQTNFHDLESQIASMSLQNHANNSDYCLNLSENCSNKSGNLPGERLSENKTNKSETSSEDSKINSENLIVKELEQKISELKAELKTVSEEQEDLLTLLSDQEHEIDLYRKRLGILDHDQSIESEDDVSV